MAYCVGNCLDWDSVSGNLTIKQDPLGGLECLPDGQRIRIAGNRRGVAVNAANNGLFMTTAGELATKVTPTCKYYAETSASYPAAGTMTIGAAYNFGTTSTITVTNTSPVYPMIVIASYQWFQDFGIFPRAGVGASLQHHGYAIINGTQSLICQEKTSCDGSLPNRTQYTYWRSPQREKQYTLAAGGTLTLAAFNRFLTEGGECAHYGSSVSLAVSGFIMERS